MESGGRRGSAVGVGVGAGGNRGEALPPKWVDISDRVEEIVERVKPKSELLQYSSAG